MIQKPAHTDQPIAEIIAERWSGRAYDADVMVSDEQITALCEAARWAPSCFGEAPWRFVVCNKFSDEAAWQKAIDSLVPGNQEWANNAPIIIFACSTPNFSHNNKPNNWAGYDTGAATLNLCLQATAFGLMSHQMGGFDKNKVHTAFNIPEEISIWSAVAIGHPASPDSLSEEQLERELSARERAPLTQQFYFGDWG